MHLSPGAIAIAIATTSLLLTHADAAAVPATRDARATCGGGDLDLSKWKLQLPTGTRGHPTEISSSNLCSGYSSEFFYMRGDALVMEVPGGPSSGKCVTTPNSQHCRTELRETRPASWDPRAKTNRLVADLRVTRNDGEICIGQIHIDDSVSSKPVAELYYNSAGDLAVGVNTCRTCGQKRTPVDHVPRGRRFTYELRYEGNRLSVGIDGRAFKTLSTYDLDAPRSYFKAGNYNQGDVPTSVQFYRIQTSHS
ncbi:alginate lyase [Metarhizium album ARSEF 1941]|uniref:Alginate lyase n=1 Tax=Metarhizium album (strain ARSEF 1941) TaxID=1081103 RepID=A0A0B2WYH1_METAS|nr:alginate lyase [Metarhizium album ARSEF 1941]KHO01302.1 alginate lyase [Metarhizium album ARSEF 1941]